MQPTVAIGAMARRMARRTHHPLITWLSRNDIVPLPSRLWRNDESNMLPSGVHPEYLTTTRSLYVGWMAGIVLGPRLRTLHLSPARMITPGYPWMRESDASLCKWISASNAPALQKQLSYSI